MAIHVKTKKIMFNPQNPNNAMKSKILISVLVILSVVEYTLAVINFTQWAVLPGIQAVALAVTMMILAFIIFRQQLDHALNDITAKTIADLLKALQKGIPATLTVKDGKATVAIRDDDPEEIANKPEGDTIPEDELTDEEKRIKRMAEEYDQLRGRLDRLTAFLQTDKFKALPDNSRTLLTKQHQAMTDYEAALRERIKIDCANTGK